MKQYSPVSILKTTVVSITLGATFVALSNSTPARGVPSQNSRELALKSADKFSIAFPPRGTNPTLRSQVQTDRFLIGAAVSARALNQNFLYRYRLSQEFNTVTAENVMKFKHLHPEPHRFDFTEADRLVAFATQHQMMIRGHTLVWHDALPDWLTEENRTRDELITILKSYIKTVVGRYRGQIMSWDVVNEAIADDGTLRDSFWLRGIGLEYIEMAFRWANEADPNARLIYNDYGGEGLNPKSDAIYQLAKSLLEQNVPIHGIGFQMHVLVNSHPSPQEVAQNMSRFADLGLDVTITEMDVRIKQPSTVDDYEQQAWVYREMLQVCLQAENCNTVVFWGFSDRHSWIPGHFEGWGDALLFDKTYRPKPTHHDLLEELGDDEP